MAIKKYDSDTKPSPPAAKKSFMATPIKPTIIKQVRKSKRVVALTDDEYKAAIAGTLQSRSVVGSRDQEYLGADAISSDGRAIGRPLGLTTGLPIAGVWCKVLADNQRLHKKDRLTDKQISAFMREEFPGRATASFDRVHEYRRMYNHGRFTKGITPKVLSNAFDNNGEPIPLVVRGPYGNRKESTSTAALAKTPEQIELERLRADVEQLKKLMLNSK